MRLIHLLRKPVSEGTVASNTLKHGTGGLNIDASRVGGENRTYKGSGVSQMRYTDGRAGLTDGRGRDMEFSVLGRWPANLILQHLDGCRCEGTTKIRAITGTRAGRHESRGWGMRGTGQPTGHGDADGNETIANWVCKAGCPVRVLDEDAGIRPSWGITHQPTRSGYDYRSVEDGGTHAYREPDTGGASRYFKQIGGEE